ncbi:hypothetical protein ABS71_17055 [bacterium SCN 62-11]|nr:hypothetical protein [Candidatus Eremiobacteraeota bacterium]ODT61035.1 MAG: hypothetical protein ABS71_17055 [bacterium SCN 62-11]
MRKLELAFVVILVACATAWWTHSKEPVAVSSQLTVTPTHNMKTRSGRYEIHSPAYQIAGIGIGSPEEGVVAALGQPDRKEDDEKAKEAHRWIYERDGQQLTVSFMEERVIGVGGSGRWGFEEPGKPGMTLFMQSRETIAARFGTPRRSDGSAVVYDAHPGELTVHFGPGGTVQQFWLVGELKHL